MINDTILERAAIADYNAAYDRYICSSIETAERFANAVLIARDGLIRFPELAPMCDEQHRYCSIRKFPYGLIYRIDGNIIRIVAVAHDRQLPGFWNDRD